MGQRVRVGRVDDFRDGKGRAVAAGELRVAVFRVGDRWFTECELTGHPQVNHERPLLQLKDQELPQSFQSRKALPFQSDGQLGRIDLKDPAATGLDSDDLQFLDSALQTTANRLHFGKFWHSLVIGYWLLVTS